MQIIYMIDIKHIVYGMDEYEESRKRRKNFLKNTVWYKYTPNIDLESEVPMANEGICPYPPDEILFGRLFKDVVIPIQERGIDCVAEVLVTYDHRLIVMECATGERFKNIARNSHKSNRDVPLQNAPKIDRKGSSSKASKTVQPER